MRIVTYILIALFAGILGYKLAELIMANKQIKTNVQPIVDELKIQLQAIQDKLSNTQGLTSNEISDLQLKKDTIVDLLAKFYGYSTEQINSMINGI